MTHPLTAAPKTPPIGGQGMGLGGHPRRVRIHCAPLLAALLLATPMSAQVIPTGTTAADILLSQAISEHRLFLTCNALDPIGHSIMIQRWEQDVTAAAAILKSSAVPDPAIAAFIEAARTEALLPANDVSFAEVRQSCLAQTDWPARYARGDFIRLALRLPKAFK